MVFPKLLERAALHQVCLSRLSLQKTEWLRARSDSVVIAEGTVRSVESLFLAGEEKRHLKLAPMQNSPRDCDVFCWHIFCVPSPRYPLMARNQRILIVDDFSDVAELLAYALRSYGYETRTASDGFQALLIAEQFRPQFVLLDIGVPGLNGFETAKRIRSETWSRGTVLVAMSGHSNAEYQRAAREAGFDRYLIKPTPLKEITGLIEEFSNRALHRVFQKRAWKERGLGC